LGIAAATHLPEYPRMGSLAVLAGQGDANICFVDVASNVEHALLLVSEAAAAMPVVALSTRKDADLILRCLHRGAGEFLAEPTAQHLRVALDRLGRLRGPVAAPKPSTVYAVVPGKPGCGASTLAVHLAIEFKRAGASRVLLVDTDVLGGTLAFLLKMKPDFHLGDAVRDRQRMDGDLWARLTVPCHGVDVLLAPENPAAAVEIDRAAAADLVKFWQAQYEAVVLDTAGAQPGAVEFVRLADQILLVATNELVALHATVGGISGEERHRPPPSPPGGEPLFPGHRPEARRGASGAQAGALRFAGQRVRDRPAGGAGRQAGGSGHAFRPRPARAGGAADGQGSAGRQETGMARAITKEKLAWNLLRQNTLLTQPVSQYRKNAAAGTLNYADTPGFPEEG
jgi:Mrp family chromosome partitioning ATPase